MADWTIQEFAVLRERWEAGDTGQQIADLFGNRSRSAVIAKARNAGFKQPPKPKKSKGQLMSKGYRKAYASKGDNMRARFVRVDQGEHGRKRRQNRPRLPGIGTAEYIDQGRTKFPKAVPAFMPALADMLRQQYAVCQARRSHASGFFADVESRRRALVPGRPSQ
jgi:hypothetical protein